MNDKVNFNIIDADASSENKEADITTHLIAVNKQIQSLIVTDDIQVSSKNTICIYKLADLEQYKTRVRLGDDVEAECNLKVIKVFYDEDYNEFWVLFEFQMPDSDRIITRIEYKSSVDMLKDECNVIMDKRMANLLLEIITILNPDTVINMFDLMSPYAVLESLKFNIEDDEEDGEDYNIIDYLNGVRDKVASLVDVENVAHWSIALWKCAIELNDIPSYHTQLYRENGDTLTYRLYEVVLIYYPKIKKFGCDFVFYSKYEFRTIKHTVKYYPVHDNIKGVKNVVLSKSLAMLMADIVNVINPDTTLAYYDFWYNQYNLDESVNFNIVDAEEDGMSDEDLKMMMDRKIHQIEYRLNTILPYTKKCGHWSDMTAHLYYDLSPFIWNDEHDIYQLDIDLDIDTVSDNNVVKLTDADYQTLFKYCITTDELKVPIYPNNMRVVNMMVDVIHGVNPDSGVLAMDFIQNDVMNESVKNFGVTYEEPDDADNFDDDLPALEAEEVIEGYINIVRDFFVDDGCVYYNENVSYYILKPVTKKEFWFKGAKKPLYIQYITFRHNNEGKYQFFIYFVESIEKKNSSGMTFYYDITNDYFPPFRLHEFVDYADASMIYDIISLLRPDTKYTPEAFLVNGVYESGMSNFNITDDENEDDVESDDNDNNITLLKEISNALVSIFPDNNKYSSLDYPGKRNYNVTNVYDINFKFRHNNGHEAVISEISTHYNSLYSNSLCIQFKYSDTDGYCFGSFVYSVIYNTCVNKLSGDVGRTSVDAIEAGYLDEQISLYHFIKDKNLARFLGMVITGCCVSQCDFEWFYRPDNEVSESLSFEIEDNDEEEYTLSRQIEDMYYSGVENVKRNVSYLSLENCDGMQDDLLQTFFMIKPWKFTYDGISYVFTMFDLTSNIFTDDFVPEDKKRSLTMNFTGVTEAHYNLHPDECITGFEPYGIYVSYEYSFEGEKLGICVGDKIYMDDFSLSDKGLCQFIETVIVSVNPNTEYTYIDLYDGSDDLNESVNFSLEDDSEEENEDDGMFYDTTGEAREKLERIRSVIFPANMYDKMDPNNYDDFVYGFDFKKCIKTKMKTGSRKVKSAEVMRMSCWFRYEKRLEVQISIFVFPKKENTWLTVGYSRNFHKWVTSVGVIVENMFDNYEFCQMLYDIAMILDPDTRCTPEYMLLKK